MMEWEQFESDELLSEAAAEIFLAAIRNNPRIVLGLPTGRSPVGMYRRIVRECAREYHCFKNVTTFNLDEYVGVAPDHPASYHTYMRHHLFKHVDVDPENVHIPHGDSDDPAAEAQRYERELSDAGGLGLTFLGLGRNGHIGFNEPGSSFDARTRVVELTPSTRKANAEFFSDGEVPTHAITMGIGTILESQSIVLIAAGQGKQDAIATLRSGELDETFPASALWKHPNVRVLVSEN